MSSGDKRKGQKKRQQKEAIKRPISKKKKKTFVGVVRKRTIPTERAPLVGEVSANLRG
jgi:hypothetical protein